MKEVKDPITVDEEFIKNMQWDVDLIARCAY